MPANWTSRSRSSAGAGKVGFSSTSASRSRPVAKSLAEDFGVHAEAVVAAIAVDAAADGLDLAGDVLGGTPRGALEQHLAGQLGEAVVVGRFGQHAAFEHGAEFDEGQSVVFFDQQAQAVGQLELLHWHALARSPAATAVVGAVPVGSSA